MARFVIGTAAIVLLVLYESLSITLIGSYGANPKCGMARPARAVDRVLRFLARRLKNRSARRQPVLPRRLASKLRWHPLSRGAPVSMISNEGPPADTGGIEAVNHALRQNGPKRRRGETVASRKSLSTLGDIGS